MLTAELASKTQGIPRCVANSTQYCYSNFEFSFHQFLIDLALSSCSGMAAHWGAPLSCALPALPLADASSCGEMTVYQGVSFSCPRSSHATCYILLSNMLHTVVLVYMQRNTPPFILHTLIHYICYMQRFSVYMQSNTLPFILHILYMLHVAVFSLHTK